MATATMRPSARARRRRRAPWATATAPSTRRGPSRPRQRRAASTADADPRRPGAAHPAPAAVRTSGAPLTAPPASSSSTVAPASPDFSGWNWVAHERTVLDARRRTARRARPSVTRVRRGTVGDRVHSVSGVGVHEVEPLVRDAGEQQRARRGASTVFQPMCGRTGACSSLDVRRATRRRPSVATPCSTPRSNSTCMPTQMPSTGRPPASRAPTDGRRPSTAARPAMHAANAPTPGTTRPSASSAASRSAVTVDVGADALERALRPSAGCPTRSRGRRRDGRAHRRAHASRAGQRALGRRARRRTRGSSATASRSARATALNCASTTWCALRPASTRTCRRSAPSPTIDSQTWRVSVVS